MLSCISFWTVILTMCFMAPELIIVDHPSPGPSLSETSPTCCCQHTETTKDWVLRRLRLLREQHWWMDENLALPPPIKKGQGQTLMTISNEDLTKH